MKRLRAFTFVEIITVIVIIGILTAVGVSSYRHYRCKASWPEVQACLSDVALRLDDYRANHGRYPKGGDWKALGYTGGSPDCGEHYEGRFKTTAYSYTIWFSDTKEPLSCTERSSFSNDTWVIVDVSPKIYHYRDSVNETEEPLPEGYSVN